VRDHYRTLAAESEYRQKIERSEFLAIAFAVDSDEAFFAALAALTKRYFDATHLCWAFRLFASGEPRARSADAGEPSGSAGKPILSAIDGADLFDAAVVVVRWYGGVKLGTGGLSRAYRETAAEALRNANVADRYIYQRMTITVPFEQLSVVYRLIDTPHVVLAGERFGDTNEFDFDVRLSRVAEFATAAAGKRLTLR
jgi:uncharacterized YigZ family protein